MAAELLEDLNQPYEILLAERPDHAKRLENYQLLVVPHVELLPELWFKAIQQFLDQGGKVISTGNTAKIDEHLAPRTARWKGDGWKHFDERVEKTYARSRKMISIHSGFERPTVPWAQAVDRALDKPSVRLERAEPVLTIHRTCLPDGEAIHLVNRYCNVFPKISTTPREGLILFVRPAEQADRIIWLSPDAGDDEVTLDYTKVGDELRIELPTLRVTGFVRIRYASAALSEELR
jgi:hypothetical protein